MWEKDRFKDFWDMGMANIEQNKMDWLSNKYDLKRIKETRALLNTVVER